MADLQGKRIDSTYIYVLNSDPNTAIITNGDGSSVDWDGNKIVLKTGNQEISGVKNFDSLPHKGHGFAFCKAFGDHSKKCGESC